jgi:hypothetical protein
VADSQVNLNGNGKTTNFDVYYNDSLVSVANMVDNANALLGVVENEYTVTTGWFGTPAGKFGTGNRQKVKLDLNATATSFPGANNSGYGSDINLDAQNATNNHTVAAQRVEMVFMAEWSEILMSLSNGKWNAGDSSGEGLSQFCSIRRFQAGHYNYYGSWVQQWLNGNSKSPNAARSDWVNTTFTGGSGLNGDQDPVSFGCALAFLYYLFTQLQFSETQIIQAGSAPLATAYHKLTGDNEDPFPAFLNLISSVYPASATATIPGPVTDDPFPLAITQIWADKDTFGKDEVNDVISKKGGVWQQALWVVIDGFSEASFNALGVTVDAFTGSFTTIPGIEIIPNLAIDYENATSPLAPQRIRVPFDVRFTAASLASFPSAGTEQFDLSTSLSAGGTKVTGSDTTAKIELVAGADPYFTNIDTTPGDPNRNNVFYLSQDLRVFTATPGLNGTPVPGGPAFGADSVAGAYTYVRQLLGYLNGNFNDPNGTDPFSSVLPGQGGALTGDSSVTPFTFVPFSGAFNNYNFAVARVRLTGTSGSAGAATDVRVFFRLWATQTIDTDYQTGSTYPSTPDGKGEPGFPLVGTGHGTIPFFASGNQGANADYGPGGPNIATITIPAGRDSMWAYYGCFLNVYDPANVIDGKAVQAYLTGTHHCLVAQIAYDDAPVIAGVSPAASDKLAQRNLQVTLSDNPGPADTHRIPQTFDLRPSDPAPDKPVDELMIDWGNVPAGSVASIYWPAVHASDVVDLADSLYASHTLSVADFNTVRCAVTGGISYVPVPRGAGDNFAGLFTIDLPQSVRTGEELRVVVRRLSTKSVSNIIIQSPPATTAPPSTLEEGTERDLAASLTVPLSAAREPDVTTWRYVVGTFSVQVPVTTADTMLLPEENTLAIMRWRLGQRTPADRWYPVLERYIELIAARVDGLGGDSGSILPSPTGVPFPLPEHGEHEREKHRVYTGKVCEVLYDCFGEFEGFVLEGCERRSTFHTRAKGIESVALRACREQLTQQVIVEEEEREKREDDHDARGRERIVRLALRR